MCADAAQAGRLLCPVPSSLFRVTALRPPGSKNPSDNSVATIPRNYDNPLFQHEIPATSRLPQSPTAPAVRMPDTSVNFARPPELLTTDTADRIMREDLGAPPHIYASGSFDCAEGETTRGVTAEPKGGECLVAQKIDDGSGVFEGRACQIHSATRTPVRGVASRLDFPPDRLARHTGQRASRTQQQH